MEKKKEREEEGKGVWSKDGKCTTKGRDKK